MSDLFALLCVCAMSVFPLVGCSEDGGGGGGLRITPRVAVSVWLAAPVASWLGNGIGQHGVE